MPICPLNHDYFIDSNFLLVSNHLILHFSSTYQMAILDTSAWKAITREHMSCFRNDRQCLQVTTFPCVLVVCSFSDCLIFSLRNSSYAQYDRSTMITWSFKVFNSIDQSSPICKRGIIVINVVLWVHQPSSGDCNWISQQQKNEMPFRFLRGFSSLLAQRIFFQFYKLWSN